MGLRGRVSVGSSFLFYYTALAIFLTTEGTEFLHGEHGEIAVSLCGLCVSFHCVLCGLFLSIKILHATYNKTHY